MKLKELKRVIDKAYKTGRGCDVEFYIELENGESVELDVKGIFQFNVIPDVTMNFVPKAEEQSFCLKNNTKETIKYKKEYEKLQKKMKKIEDLQKKNAYFEKCLSEIANENKNLKDKINRGEK